MTGSLSAVGYGFAAYIQSTARQPESGRITLPYVWIAAALIEALALFGIAFGFVFRN
jgi:F-type H+-transporting ATPase subunit c